MSVPEGCPVLWDAASAGACGAPRSSALVRTDVGPTERPDQLRVRVRASQANPTSEHDDYRLLVGPFARALQELRAAGGAADTDRVIPLSLSASTHGCSPWPYNAFAHGKLVVRTVRRVSPYSCRSRSSEKRTCRPDRTWCLRQSHWRSRRVAWRSIAA